MDAKKLAECLMKVADEITEGLDGGPEFHIAQAFEQLAIKIEQECKIK